MADVKVIISAEDNATRTFKAIEQSSASAFKKLEASSASTTKTIKQHWLEISVAGVAAWMAVSKAMDYAKLGASAMQAEESFKNVTAAYGVHADQMLAKMKQVSAGIIDDSNLMQRAVKALQQGLSETQIVQLLEVARSSARVAGTDVASAFDGITNAVANQTTRSLKLYGLIIDQDKAFKDYAKTLGITKDALTEQQQSQALANAAIEEGQRQSKAMGEIIKNASEIIQEANAIITEFKETIGKKLILATGIAVKHIDALAIALSAAAIVSAPAVFKAIAASLIQLRGAALAASFAVRTLGAAFAAILGYELGKALDVIIYKISGLDLSGLNKPTQQLKEATEELAWAKEELAKRQEKALLKEQATTVAFKLSEEAIKSVTKVMQDYSNIIKTIGTDALKFAGDEFTQNLKSQEKSIEGMKTALEGYLSIIDAVYAKQLAGQNAILNQLRAAGAGQEALLKQQIVITETEKAQAEARLSAWSQYYEILKSLHASAIDAQKTKTQELLQLETQIKTQRQGYADLELSLRQRLMTETEKYYSTQENLEGKFRAASLLSGQAKIDALTQWQQAAASAAHEVREGDKIIVSGEQAINTALNQIAEAQRAITTEQEAMTAAKQTEIELTKQWAGELEIAMAKAQEMIGLYQIQITELNNAIANLSKEIILTVNTDEAMTAVKELKSEIDSIPDVTYKKVIIQTFTESSPIRPFSQGIEYMQEKLNSLSGRGEFTMDLSALSSLISAYAGMAQIIAPYAARTAGTPMAWGKSTYFAMEQSVRELFQPSMHLLEEIFKKFAEGFGIQGFGSYQTGTSYVPQTGLYKLHQGEAVIPANQNTYDNRRSSQQVTYAPVININGANKSPQQIAAEVDKVLARRARYNRSEFAREMN